MPTPEIREACPMNVPDSDALRFLPEGPCTLAGWSRGGDRFSWVGIQHGADSNRGSLNIYDLSSQANQSFDLPGRPGFAFPTADSSESKFVVGCERSLGIYDSADGSWNVFCEGVDEDVDNTIINDGIVVDDNLIFGTKDLEFATRKAGLYLWRGRDQNLIRLRDDQICSNGKAIRTANDGGLRLIDIDSPTRKIVSYPIDIDSAILGDPEVVVDFVDDPAVPDGAVVTPDGRSIIVSMFLPRAADFGETRMYDIETGELLITWRTPGSPQNTCPAIVRNGADWNLVITTAVENMTSGDREKCPAAGRLFLAKLDSDLGQGSDEHLAAIARSLFPVAQ